MVRGAVLYNFNEALKIESLELKPPREDEVVVKVAASGVCHSDLSVQQMKLPIPPPVRARPRGRRHRRGGRQGRHDAQAGRPRRALLGGELRPLPLLRRRHASTSATADQQGR